MCESSRGDATTSRLHKQMTVNVSSGGDDVEDGESVPDPQLPEYNPGDAPEEGEDDEEDGEEEEKGVASMAEHH